MEVVELRVQSEAGALVGLVQDDGLVLALPQQNGQGYDDSEEQDPEGGEGGQDYGYCERGEVDPGVVYLDVRVAEAVSASVCCTRGEGNEGEGQIRREGIKRLFFALKRDSNANFFNPQPRTQHRCAISSHVLMYEPLAQMRTKP